MLRASCYVSVLPPHPSGCVVGGGEEGREGGGSAAVKLCPPGEGTALAGARQPFAHI